MAIHPPIEEKSKYALYGFQKTQCDTLDEVDKWIEETESRIEAGKVVMQEMKEQMKMLKAKLKHLQSVHRAICQNNPIPHP